jgi:syntaxin 7
MAKRGTEDLKKLAVAQASLVHGFIAFFCSQILLMTLPQPHQRGALQKTSHDFQMSFMAFQKASQLSADKQRTVVESVKIAVDEDNAQYVPLARRGLT